MNVEKNFLTFLIFGYVIAGLFWTIGYFVGQSNQAPTGRGMSFQGEGQSYCDYGGSVYVPCHDQQKGE